MGELHELLQGAGREWEPDLRRRLQGMLGSIFQAYLPQAWVFRTEHETATLRVEKDGKIGVTDGVSELADVTVEVPLRRLAAALRSQDRSAIPPAELKVTTHTAKGKAAFDYLRSRLGL
jgi:hypothetical protein